MTASSWTCYSLNGPSGGQWNNLQQHWMCTRDFNFKYFFFCIFPLTFFLCSCYWESFKGFIPKNTSGGYEPYSSFIMRKLLYCITKETFKDPKYPSILTRLNRPIKLLLICYANFQLLEFIPKCVTWKQSTHGNQNLSFICIKYCSSYASTT